MKKFNLKNCIAFTLTEMTLVLLITGVIAVATTPVITSALSDASKNSLSAAESEDSPWRIASKYNGGGIFNIPMYTYSVTSIGLKPGASASNYNFAALAIQSNSSNNLANAPQIQILNNKGWYNGAFQYLYSNIAADEYQNFAFTYGNSFQNQKVGANGVNNTYLGAHNVFMGGNIQSTSALDKAYYDKSIFIGQNINTAYAINSVFVGSDITKNSDELNSVNIGFGMEPYVGSYSAYSNADNVNLGLAAGSRSHGSYNVNIGKYAAVDSIMFNSVAIGTQAAQGLGYYSSAYSSLRLGSTYLYANQDNVAVGYRAGYSTITPVSENNYISGNTLIGKYAGAVETTNSTATSGSNAYSKQSNNTVIGQYAGLYKFTTSPVHEYEKNVMIGDFAGYAWSTGTGLSNRRGVNNSVDIGYYAGSGTRTSAGINHIYIGQYAGANTVSAGNSCILIGSYAGSNMSGINGNIHEIAIGYYAGNKSQGSYSLYVGYYAGYESKKSGISSSGGATIDSKPQNANVGIGYNTCKGVTGGGKWCLGGGTLDANLTYSNGTNIWSKSNTNNQMVIGFVDKGISGQTITLYASKVVKNTGTAGEYANVFNLSDKRLKNNIVPSKHSIEDIRKINIYDYNMKADPRKTPRIGIIAQEYRKIFPHDVTKDSASKKLRASANWMIFSMINAVKDVDKYIQNLESEFKVYIDDFAALKAKVAKLEKQANQIEKENAQMRKHLTKINSQLK